LEQDGEVGFGAADGAQSDICGGFGGQYDVERTDLGHLLKQFSGGVAEAAAVHPLLEGAPHHQGQEAHEDVGLGAVLPVMVDGPKPQVVLVDAEAVFDLGQSDIGFPEGGGVLPGQVGAQQGSRRTTRPIRGFLRVGKWSS